MSRRPRATLLLAALLGVTGVFWVTPAHADAVDDAYAAGNEASKRGDWAQAVRHYEHAGELLPGRSATLSHDLGVAQAHLGALGPATFHLQQALQARPDDAVAESVRRNLGIVRRRAEFAAERSDAQISDPPGSWDLLAVALSTQAVAWISILAGWAALFAGAAWARERRERVRARAQASSGWVGALGLVLALVYVFGGLAHELARQATDDPRAVSLPDLGEVREGPGTHRGTAFELQGGSIVRVVETTPGWCKIRMPGGLTGWIPAAELGMLDGPAR